jgi:hypothetical protein
MMGQEPNLQLNNQANDNIGEISGLSEPDLDCIREIKDVLKNHGSLHRFGIARLHDHFPLESDEVLVETCNHSTRELTIKPIRRSEMAKINVIETIWRLDSENQLVHCIQRCECSETRIH